MPLVCYSLLFGCVSLAFPIYRTGASPIHPYQILQFQSWYFSIDDTYTSRYVKNKRRACIRMAFTSAFGKRYSDNCSWHQCEQQQWTNLDCGPETRFENGELWPLNYTWKIQNQNSGQLKCQIDTVTCSWKIPIGTAKPVKPTSSRSIYRAGSECTRCCSLLSLACRTPVAASISSMSKPRLTLQRPRK